MKKYKKLIATILSLTVLGLQTNVHAANENMATNLQGALSQDEILDQCTDELAEIPLNLGKDTNQANQRQRVLKEYADVLERNGYDAYVVEPDNYVLMEQMLDTDLSEMGIKPEYTYLITFGDSAENTKDNTMRSSVGSTFSYTYNGVSYTMRYCTVTAADDPIYSKASDCDLLTSTSTKLIQNCLDTAIKAYMSAVWSPLGTVASICGLNIADFAADKSATLRLNCGSNWTRVYTQVYSNYDKTWINGSCVESVKMLSYISGTYFEASTNSMVSIPQKESRTTKYTSNYNNSTWKKQKAVLALLNGQGCTYESTGSVSYYYGNVKKITHSHDF